MEGFTPILSSIGGVLIGLTAIGLLCINGRITGISGIVEGVLRLNLNNTLWRVIFIGGTLAGVLKIVNRILTQRGETVDG